MERLTFEADIPRPTQFEARCLRLLRDSPEPVGESTLMPVRDSQSISLLNRIVEVGLATRRPSEPEPFYTPTLLGEQAIAALESPHSESPQRKRNRDRPRPVDWVITLAIFAVLLYLLGYVAGHHR